MILNKCKEANIFSGEICMTHCTKLSIAICGRGKFTELCAPPDDVTNPDTTAFGFPTFLGLPEQIQSSNSGYFCHG